MADDATLGGAVGGVGDGDGLAVGFAVVALGAGAAAVGFGDEVGVGVAETVGVAEAVGRGELVTAPLGDADAVGVPLGVGLVVDVLGRSATATKDQRELVGAEVPTFVVEALPALAVWNQ
jgi:hypothetical protein